MGYLTTLSVLSEILQAFEAGKTIQTSIRFGTVNGYFFVESIEPKELGDQWVFQGGNFSLSTGRYNFLRKEQNNDENIRYIFSTKSESHPKKFICFEIIDNE
jgi:hypothetical protein